MITKNWRPDTTGLEMMLKTLKPLDTIVEIGSFLGDSTIVLAKYAKLIFSVDPYIQDYDPTDVAATTYNMRDVETTFLERTRPYDNIIKMRMTSVRAAEHFSKVDLVYIDGNHQEVEVRKDIMNWSNKARYIGGHNYDYPHWPGVKKVVDSIFHEVEVFPEYNWLVRR